MRSPPVRFLIRLTSSSPSAGISSEIAKRAPSRALSATVAALASTGRLFLSKALGVKPTPYAPSKARRVADNTPLPFLPSPCQIINFSAEFSPVRQ